MKKERDRGKGPREERKRDEQWNVAFLRWGECNSCENPCGIQRSDSCYTLKGGKFLSVFFTLIASLHCCILFVPARVMVVILIHAF
jgi:hypothetical protein